MHQLNFDRYFNPLKPRAKALYNVPEYRAALAKALQFPGIRRTYRPEALETFLRGRTIEVRQAADTQLSNIANE